MFEVDNISSLNAPWILPNKKEKEIFIVPETAKHLKSYNIISTDYLFRNYKSKLMGAILNEDSEMNMQLSVCVFLNVVFQAYDLKGIVLIISLEHCIPKWIFHISKHAGLKPKIVSEDMCPEEFIQETGLALILSFQDIKLVESLEEYSYFCVIIDDFDQIASKLIIRKLHGKFNIGLTERNFYENPDQKLQWLMLNWCHRGCVGKLKHYYNVDDDNFANMRDNYRLWWFRLTWCFCKSYIRPSEDEILNYNEKLKNWLEENGYSAHIHFIKKEKRKRKMKTNLQTSEYKRKAPPIEKEIFTQTERESSSDTIIGDDYVKLPSMDELPIVTSIINNLRESNVSSYETDFPKISRDADDSNILLSIMSGEPTIKLEQVEPGCSKQELPLKKNESDERESDCFFKKLFSSKAEDLSENILQESCSNVNKNEIKMNSVENDYFVKSDIEEDLEKVLLQADELLKKK